MKKEWIAFALLLLLFGGTLLNIRVCNSYMDELKSEVKQVYESAEKGDFESSKSQLDEAVRYWLSLDGYTHIFIRHTEIDATTEAFFGFMSDIQAEDADSAKGSYGLLTAQLDSLITMEMISLGSIF